MFSARLLQLLRLHSAAPPCHSVNAAELDEQSTRRRFHHNTDKTFGRTFNDRVNSACIICTNSNIKPVGQPAYLPSNATLEPVPSLAGSKPPLLQKG